MGAQLVFRDLALAALAVQRLKDLEVHRVVLGVGDVERGLGDAEFLERGAEQAPVAVGRLLRLRVVVVGHREAEALHLVLHPEILVDVGRRAVRDPLGGGGILDFALQHSGLGVDLRRRFIVCDGEIINVCADGKLRIATARGPGQVFVVAAREAEAQDGCEQERRSAILQSFFIVCSSLSFWCAFVIILPMRPVVQHLNRRMCIFCEGQRASASPHRIFSVSSSTSSGGFPASATLMYGRLPAESMTLFGMP